jgi:hypothetical protein
MLREAFGEHSLIRTGVFWMTFVVQGQSSVNWRWQTFRVNKYQQNDRKCWKILKSRQWGLSQNNPWARRHCWNQLWSLPGDLNRKFEDSPHCSFITIACPPTCPWKPQSSWP